MRLIQSITQHIDGVRSLQFFQLLRYSSQILIAVLLVKLNFSRQEIGQYETFLLISGLFSFFWVSGLINALLSLFKVPGGEDKKSLLFNGFLLMMSINLGMIALLGLFSGQLAALTATPDESRYFGYILVFMALNNPSFLTEYIYLLHEQFKRIAVYGIIIFSLMLLCVIVPILMGLGVQGVFGGMIVFAGIKFLWAVVELVRYTSLKVNVPTIGKLLSVGIPIVLSIFLSGSAEYIDGLIVKYFYDDAAFSVFRYGARELPFVILLANAFSIATIPMIAENLNSGLEQLKRRSAGMMHWMFAVSIVLMVCSEWLFIQVFSPEFRYSATLFNIYLLLIIPRLIFPQTVLTGLRKTKYLMYSSLIEVTLNVGLSLILIGKFGIAGVAYATVIAFVADKVFLVAVAFFRFKIRPGSYIPVKIYLLYAVLIVAAFYYLQW